MYIYIYVHSRTHTHLLKPLTTFPLLMTTVKLKSKDIK